MEKSKLILCAALLIGVGYGLNSWFNPVKARGEEIAPQPLTIANRFQTIKTANEGFILLDDTSGEAFRFLTGDSHNNPVFLEIPFKACSNEDCTDWKTASLGRK